MQAEQRQRRRRRRVEGRPQLLFPVVMAAAAAGVCFSASFLGANAFVPQAGIAGSGRRHVLPHGSVGLRAAAPSAACSSVEKGWQRSPKMVLRESTPATCQRAALQRAWRASSTESIAHEQVRLVACVLAYTTSHIQRYPPLNTYLVRIFFRIVSFPVCTFILWSGTYLLHLPRVFR